MKGSMQVAKGRIEEAAGVLTGSKKLRAKGRRDQVAGRVRQAGEKAVEKVKKSGRKIVKQAKNTARKTVKKAGNA